MMIGHWWQSFMKYCIWSRSVYVYSVYGAIVRFSSLVGPRCKNLSENTTWLMHGFPETLPGSEKTRFYSKFKKTAGGPIPYSIWFPKRWGVAAQARQIILHAYLYSAAEKDNLERQGNTSFGVYKRCFADLFIRALQGVQTQFHHFDKSLSGQSYWHFQKYFNSEFLT